MTDTTVLEPAVDPNNRIGFLLDWELTMKCNLDCSYCPSGLWGGHDNSIPHPPLEQCLPAVDFMYAYADLYMQKKIPSLRTVFLNVYGGESLHHPNIETILEYANSKYQEYRDKWNLAITTTTNLILTEKKLNKIKDYIDEFTISYHPETTAKQKDQFFNNVLNLKESGKRIKIVILIHHDEERFQDAERVIDWCKENGIKYIPKPLDNFNYNYTYKNKQVFFLNQYNKQKTFGNVKTLELEDNSRVALSGRNCCGGRQVCLNTNYKDRQYFVNNVFTDWYCSVNEFFLFVKQINGQIFSNKDCKMNFNGEVAPIGHLEDYNSLLEYTKKQLDENTLPVIQCKKSLCLCGLCAPKSKDLSVFNNIMKKYRKQNA